MSGGLSTLLLELCPLLCEVGFPFYSWEIRTLKRFTLAPCHPVVGKELGLSMALGHRSSVLTPQHPSQQLSRRGHIVAAVQSGKSRLRNGTDG